VKRATESKQPTHSVTTVDGSPDSEQEKPHMAEQSAESRLEMNNVRQTVSNYVHGRRWDTLVGKAFHMGSEESREEFIDFLTRHIEAMSK